MNPIAKIKKLGLLKRLPSYLLTKSKDTPQSVSIIFEDSGWSIAEDAKMLYELGIRSGLAMELHSSPIFLKNRVIHFASIYSFLRYASHLHPSNRCIATFFHAQEGLDKDLDRTIAQFKAAQHRLDKVFVSCHKMREMITAFGTCPEKIALVPIGVNLEKFTRPTIEQREAARKKFGVPPGYFCVGSFQKDGVGWGEGLTPKLVKGPDLFVDTVKKLKAHGKVFVLLSGPARGFVKKCLSEAGIEYQHYAVANHADLAEMYWALDVYIVSSRAEGGPKAMHESFATGVPLVSTPVGMIPDYATHLTHAWITASISSDELYAGAKMVWETPGLRDTFIKNSSQLAPKLGWEETLTSAIRIYKDLLSVTSSGEKGLGNGDRLILSTDETFRRNSLL